VVAVVLLVILGKGLWEMYEVRRDAAIAEDFAKAKTDEQLRRFAADHPGNAPRGRRSPPSGRRGVRGRPVR
jgi:hypothetical protein